MPLFSLSFLSWPCRPFLVCFLFPFTFSFCLSMFIFFLFSHLLFFFFWFKRQCDLFYSILYSSSFFFFFIFASCSNNWQKIVAFFFSFPFIDSGLTFVEASVMVQQVAFSCCCTSILVCRILHNYLLNHTKYDKRNSFERNFQYRRRRERTKR